MRTILIDTNVFIRFLVRDVESQFTEAVKFFNQLEKGLIKGRISILVVNETIWILESYYNLKRAVYIPELLKLLALKNLRVIEISKNTLIEILEKMKEKKIDFTDLYLLETKANCEIFSFDKDLKG